MENSATAHEDEIESLSKEVKDSKLLIEESDKKYEEVRSDAGTGSRADK